MAYTIEVLRGATSYNINNGAPFSLEQGDDLGGASVRNIEERGPYQDGATHLGERLEPDVLTLRINVIGATGAALDGHRDTLNTIFKPVVGVPITLKITRDDGAVRQLDCRRTGKLAIPLIAANYPGHLHRGVVQLRAADPTWYNPTQGTTTFAEPGSWWLALDTIGSANVMTHVEAPTAGQVWTHSGSVAQGAPFTIFFRSANPGTAAGQQWAFVAIGPLSASSEAYTNAFLDTAAIAIESRVAQGSISALAAGTANYFFQTSGSALSFYKDATLFGPYTNGTIETAGIAGTAAGTSRWRRDFNNTNSWPVALPYAAVYNIELSAAQRAALALTVAGSAMPVSIAYVGDVDSYPVITITGPFANPILTNTTTGDTLDFTGGTIGSADTWTIDTRYGRKSVLNASGSSVANYLSNDSDLATFRIVPAPIAAGGTNVIALGGSAQGAGAGAVLAYYTRYLSF